MTLLVAVTVVEIVLLVVVLASYLVVIARRLSSIADYFAKVTFGVRAIESQTAAIGPAVIRANQELEAVVAALPSIVERAERAAEGS